MHGGWVGALVTTLVGTASGGTRAWTDPLSWTPNQTPLAGDDCQLTSTSGAITINSGAVARSLDCSTGGGYTGTLTHTAGVTLTLGDATAGAGNVALKLVAGMTYTLGNAATSAVSFVSTSATQQTITTGGKSLGSWSVSGTGSSFLLGDANTVGATATVTLSAGTLNTGNFACSWGLFVISGATAKTLTLGSSAIAITGSSVAAVNVTGSGVTYTANTAVMTFSGANAGIQGATAQNWNGTSAVFTTANTAFVTLAGPTLNNVTWNGPANKVGLMSVGANGLTITGTLTLTSNSSVNRIALGSTTSGTSRTVTVGTSVALSNVDFSDITAAGAAGAWTGTSMGNALGNSNITFDTPATQTHTASAGGNWSDVTKWTSRVPLPQDNVIVDVNTTGTITADMPRLGADVTFTGFVGTAAFNSTANTLYGSLVLGSGMTVSGAQNMTFSARSSKTITSNGVTLTHPNLAVFAPGGTYTLTDALNNSTTTGFLSVSAGSFDTANFPMTTGAVSVTGTTTRTVTLGTSTITLTRTSASNMWDATTTTGLTFSGASATLVVSATSANPRTFIGGGLTYGTLTYTVAGSTGSLNIVGSNTFATINFSDATNARSLLFTAGTTTTVTNNFNVVGTAGKLMTVDSVTAATYTLTKPSGLVSDDYLNIAHSIATGGAGWYAGAHSTDAGTNTGWIFTAPPAPFFFMF